ncbi:MAG TPA: glycosyl hydrolase family 28-related protein [Pyrinomonadaceae bacterium]
MLKQFLLLSFFVLLFTANLFAQNKFEGYNILLDAPDTQRGATCAIRYAPTTTAVTITDLNPATPMNVSACSGSGTTVARSGANYTMRANAGNAKWCFQGEDKKYRISFVGDQYTGSVIYEWPATPDEKTLGFYNVKDLGAVGDGRTDDTTAIRSALAFIATRNGGILTFPEGEYIVNSPLTLPSGIIIQGVNGLHSGASTNNLTQRNTSRITLGGIDRALFKLGECTEKVSIRDIELYAQNSQNTYGIEAVGAYTSSQGFSFDNISFNNFYRGIYAHGLNVTNQLWQFDYIKVNQCRFIYNSDAGIYTNVKNSDWEIEGCLFINPKRTPTQRADSMSFEHGGIIMIQDTFGGGFAGALGGTFINILDNTNLTVLNSQTESMTNAFYYNEANNPYAGDYSYPITFVNCIFGDPITFNARRTFVSTGNLYLGNTFRADERLRVYSTGDRFCYDGATLGCVGAAKNNFDKAQIIFMTGQPDDRNIPGHPTLFGTDVQFNGTVQMPSFLQTALPNGKPNGSLVYCSNCRRSTTPCQGGGTGAPAMVVNNQWSCL